MKIKTEVVYQSIQIICRGSDKYVSKYLIIYKNLPKSTNSRAYNAVRFKNQQDVYKTRKEKKIIKKGDFMEEEKKKEEEEKKETEEKEEIGEQEVEEKEEEEKQEEKVEETQETAEEEKTEQTGEEKKDRFGRTMYSVKCSECGKDTEVPFKPSGDRPVYCRECYQKHRPSRRF